MKKQKKYLKIEYSVAILIFLGILLFLVPFSFGNKLQADFISKWNAKYNRVEYMFSVINAHISGGMLKNMDEHAGEREKLLLAIVKPYLRINTETVPPKRYKPRFKNGSKLYKGQLYYFEDFYFAENNTIVGIKDIKSEKANDAWFIMMFDINGILPPNRWGRDIYGVNIYDGGKIEPFGFDLDMKELKADCLKTGVSCSYYYKIGGGFDD